jgi:hypothetical protein
MSVSLPLSQAEMEAPLQAQIKSLLRALEKCKKKPLLTLEELTVAKLAIRPGMTLYEVQRYILTNFTYYNKAAVDTSIMRSNRAMNAIGEFNGTFRDMLRRFDVPIEVSPAPEDKQDQAGELRVHLSEARFFLHKHITPAQMVAQQEKTSFPLMKLPVEIRLIIYGYVLGLPKSGVVVRPSYQHTKKSQITVRTRDYSVELDMSDWESRAGAFPPYARRSGFSSNYETNGTLIGPELNDHLAILGVNKEIYNEAMPVFYSVNSFVCGDLYRLEEFLKALAAERRQQLKHISFFYTKGTHAKAAKAFKMLGEIKMLKRLDIWIDEEDFVGLTKSDGARMFPDVLRLPGFHTLRSLRAVKTVQFHGKCDTIREALQSWVEDKDAKAVQVAKAEQKKSAKLVKSNVRVTRATKEEEPQEEEPQEEPQKEEPQDTSLFGFSTDAFTNNNPIILNPFAIDPSELEADEHVPVDTYSFQGIGPISMDSTKYTPPVPAADNLQSPFRFNPSSLGSRGSRLHGLFIKSPPKFDIEKHSLFSGHTTPSRLYQQEMAPAEPSPMQVQQGEMMDLDAEYEEEYETGQVVATTGQRSPIPAPFPVFPPMPNIETRELMYGPGQMGDWKHKPTAPAQQTWNLPTPVPTPTFAHFGPDDPFVTQPPMGMEDLVFDQEEYGFQE